MSGGGWQHTTEREGTSHTARLNRAHVQTATQRVGGWEGVAAHHRARGQMPHGEAQQGPRPNSHTEGGGGGGGARGHKPHSEAEAGRHPNSHTEGGLEGGGGWQYAIE